MRSRASQAKSRIDPPCIRNGGVSKVIEHAIRVDLSTLELLVREVVGIASAEIEGWQCSQLGGGLMGAGVYRFSGTARDRGELMPWTIMLKAVRIGPCPIDPTEFFNGDEPAGDSEGEDLVEFAWRREPLAYTSGILQHLPPGLSAPRCFGVVAKSSEETWIWLEEVCGQVGTAWSRERIVLGARHLGRFNGAYLAGEPLPSAPWLQRDMLRAWIAYLTPSVELVVDGVRHGHPLLLRGWPTDVVDALSQLWADRNRLCDALDRLPQAFCHHDANARNLIARCDVDADDQMVAVDWGFAGIGPPGYDIVPLCGELLPSFRFEFADAISLIDEIFDGYLAGLTDVGWRVDRGLVRFAFTAALALRYGARGGPANVSDLLDEGRLSVPEQRWGRPMDEIMDRWAKCSRFLVGLADEARALLG